MQYAFSSQVVCWALAGVYRMQTGSDPDAFPEGALDRQLALGMEMGHCLSFRWTVVNASQMMADGTLDFLSQKAQRRPTGPSI